jgi:hypothetical protein
MTRFTIPAVAVNVAVVEVAGTVTDDGTFKITLLPDVRETVVPPVGAGPESVTTHVALALEGRLVGVHWSEDKVTAA